MKWNSPFVLFLRWLTFLPVYVLVSYLGYLLFSYLILAIFSLTLGKFLGLLFLCGGIVGGTFYLLVGVPLTLIRDLCPSKKVGAIILAILCVWLFGSLLWVLWEYVGSDIKWVVFRLILLSLGIVWGVFFLIHNLFIDDIWS